MSTFRQRLPNIQKPSDPSKPFRGTTDSGKGTYSAPDGSPIWEYIATFCCTLIMLSFGTVIGWTSPSLVKLMAPDSPIPVTITDASTLASVISVGSIVAQLLCAPIVDKIGRRSTLLIAAIPLIISWSMIIAAENVMTLYIARFISGITTGCAICVCPMYLGEIATAKTRGAVTMMIGIMSASGILFIFIVGPHVSLPLMASICMVLSIIFLISFWFMPESPYYLAMVGKNEEAERVLAKLRGKTDVTEEFESLKKGINSQEKSRKSGSFKELVTVRGTRRGFFIVLLFITTQHFGGHLTLLIYGQIIFKQLGSLIPDHRAAVAIAVVKLISTILSFSVVDRLGRKPMILFSGLISGLCCGIIGVFFFMTDHMGMDLANYAIVPFIAILVLIFAICCGLIPLQMVFTSEVFPSSIKAVASCSMALIGAVLGIIGTKMYLVVASTWGYGHGVPFIGYCFITWTATLLLLRLAPETKGKTLAQIQIELNE